MKYRILATYTFEHYVEFDSEKNYTKDELRDIVSDILHNKKEANKEFKPRIDWNVCSGMDIEYEIEGKEEINED